MYKLLLILALFLSACSSQKPEVKEEIIIAPSWYLHVKSDSNKIIGYGEAKDREEALSLARDDIAKSISVKLHSDFMLDTKVSNEAITKELALSIHEVSDIELVNIEVLKEQRIKGYHFIALVYDDSSIFEKMQEIIDTKNPRKMREENIYYKTYFSQKLKERMGFVPDYKLSYKNGVIRVSLNSKQFLLKKSAIKLLFFEYNSRHIQLQLSQKNIYTKEYYSLAIEPQESGYISLFNIDEEAKVTAIFANKYAEQGTYTFPDLKKYEGYQSEALKGKNQSIEAYIVLYCNKKRDFALFDEVSKSYNHNSEAERLTTLYPLLNPCHYSSQLLKVKQ